MPPAPVQDTVYEPVCEIDTCIDPDGDNVDFSKLQYVALVDVQDKVVTPGLPSDTIEIGEAESDTVGRGND